jgi:hypothetical protein
MWLELGGAKAIHLKRAKLRKMVAWPVRANVLIPSAGRHSLQVCLLGLSLVEHPFDSEAVNTP